MIPSVDRYRVRLSVDRGLRIGSVLIAIGRRKAANRVRLEAGGWVVVLDLLEDEWGESKGQVGIRAPGGLEENGRRK